MDSIRRSGTEPGVIPEEIRQRKTNKQKGLRQCSQWGQRKRGESGVMETGRGDTFKKEGVINYVKYFQKLNKMKTQWWSLHLAKEVIHGLEMNRFRGMERRKLTRVGWAKKRRWGSGAVTTDNSLQEGVLWKSWETGLCLEGAIMWEDVFLESRHQNTSDLSWKWSRREREIDHVGDRGVYCRRKVFGKGKGMVSRVWVERLVLMKWTCLLCRSLVSILRILAYILGAQ